MRFLAGDIVNKEGETVEIAGWVAVRRDHGKIIFIDLRDRSGIAQLIFTPAGGDIYELAGSLRPEWVIKAAGKVSRRPKGMENPELPTGDFEISASSLQILSRAKELPFDPASPISLETFLDFQPLTLRTEKNRNIFKIQAEIVFAFREFLRSRGFVEIQVPKIVAQATEGGANVFKLDYFGSLAYLAQSPQFYKQIMVGVFERVFTVGSAYRAEEHSTTRHLNEYASLDLEFGFIKDHADVMTLENELLVFIIDHLAKLCAKELEFFGIALPAVPEKIPSLKLREAQKVLEEKYGFKTAEPDLNPQEERLICEYASENLGSEFVFITHYPTTKRPFYTYPDPDEPELSRSFDLLFKGVEITTGGQRLNDYEALVDSIKKRGFKSADFDFYLQAFKYGMPPEGGLAIGLERLTQKLLNVENVREVALFPRDMRRIDVFLSAVNNERINKQEK